MVERELAPQLHRFGVVDLDGAIVIIGDEQAILVGAHSDDGGFVVVPNLRHHQKRARERIAVAAFAALERRGLGDVGSQTPRNAQPTEPFGRKRARLREARRPRCSYFGQ